MQPKGLDESKGVIFLSVSFKQELVACHCFEIAAVYAVFFLNNRSFNLSHSSTLPRSSPMKSLFPLVLLTGCLNGDKVKVEIEVDDVILPPADTSTIDSGSIDSGSVDSGTLDDGVIDLDGDGFAADVDCDDTSSTTYPGAPELCNLIDDNCNDEIDEGAGDIWYSDLDGDGYGTTASPSPVTRFWRSESGKRL